MQWPFTLWASPLPRLGRKLDVDPKQKAKKDGILQ
jgi:hypothetical protein